MSLFVSIRVYSRPNLLSCYEYPRRVERLPDNLLGHDPEVARLDEVQYPLLDLPTPEGGREFSQHAVDPIEDGRVFADHHEREPASGPEHPVELLDGTHDILRRKQLEQITAHHRVETGVAEGHLARVHRLA